MDLLTQELNKRLNIEPLAIQEKGGDGESKKKRKRKSTKNADTDEDATSSKKKTRKKRRKRNNEEIYAEHKIVLDHLDRKLKKVLKKKVVPEGEAVVFSQCSGCEKNFTVGDDVIACPECYKVLLHENKKCIDQYFDDETVQDNMSRICSCEMTKTIGFVCPKCHQFCCKLCWKFCKY